MSRAPVSIHPLAEDDLPEVAAVHVRVWQQAYRGQMPQDFLDGLTAGQRLEGWRRRYAENGNDARFGTLLARDGATGGLAGFLSYGPARDDGHRGQAELYAINILDEYRGRGAGHALFTSACGILRRQFHKSTYLWVLSTNENAIAAYRRWGGAPDPARNKEVVIGGAALREIAVDFRL